MIVEPSPGPRTGDPGPATIDPATIIAELEAGRRRAAVPDAAAPGGWRADPAVKAAILARFADRRTRTWAADEVFTFRDRVGLPVRPGAIEVGEAGEADGTGDDGTGDDGTGDDGTGDDGRPRVVPGGTTIRGGAHLGRRVVVMPPSYVNIGAWIGDDTMVDSHVLVGSCAQVGARVHLAAGVQVGGVLEPPGARPVVIEDDAFIGAGAILLDGVVVGRRAVIAAGVTLTGTTRLYDLVRERVLEGHPAAPLVIPAGAVVVPGARAAAGEFARVHGLAVTVPLIVKDRDARTDARVALEEALR